MKRYKLAIFDFDGTLADTRASILATVELVLKQAGRPAMERKEIEKLIGLPLTATFEAAGFSGSDLESAITAYRAQYDEVAAETVTLFPGVESTLDALQRSRVRMAVASSKGRAAIPTILGRLGVLDFFELVAGDQDSERKKPAPDLALFVLSKCQVSADESIVIGDTRYDIEMGRSAGCDTCAVTFGYGKDVRASAPTFIAETFPDVLSCFEVSEEESTAIHLNGLHHD